MTGTLLALSLILLGGEDPKPAVVAEGPTLTIDSCIAVDQATVRQVMELELGDARKLPPTVHVRCVEGAQEIRIRRSTGTGPEDVRTLPMAVASGDETPGVRQARSRELALSIAEFVRWLGPALLPPPNPPDPASAVPVTGPATVMATTPAPEAPIERWQLGIQYAFEHFSRGQSLMGVDLSVASRRGRWFLTEFRLAGRMGADQTMAGTTLSTRAAVVAVGAGVIRWSHGHQLGGALVLRAQGYLVELHAVDASTGSSASVARGAFALLLEPRLLVALTPRFSLQASAAAGLVARGITVRLQGASAQTLSGFAVTTSLAGVFTF